MVVATKVSDQLWIESDCGDRYLLFKISSSTYCFFLMQKFWVWKISIPEDKYCVKDGGRHNLTGEEYQQVLSGVRAVLASKRFLKFGPKLRLEIDKTPDLNY